MKKITTLLILIGLLFCLYVLYKFGFAHHLELESIKIYIKDLHAWTSKNYVISVIVYTVTYFTVIVAGIPATAPVVMVGGFLFGTVSAVLYSAIAATLGAIVAFLLFRSVLKETIEQKYADKLAMFRVGLQEHGAFYLLLLHFMFLVPFFVINMLAALARVSLWRFIWTTFLGILPCLFVYAFSGKKLFSIRSIQEIFSWKIILVIILLLLVTMLPIIYKLWKKKRGALEF
ncbi:TVP38/TMEM64 family protein [Candidatus Dependentiae bacterium]